MKKENNGITAFVLGAGLGTRLRPITDTVPKVMVPFLGKPLLERTVCLLRDQGFTDIVVNVHYLPDVIRDYFGDGSRFGVRMRYSDETAQLLETAGALKKAEPLLSDTFLLIYGDHTHRFDFRDAVAFHGRHGGAATAVLKKSRNPQNGEVWETDPASGRIVAGHVRPHAVTEYGPNMRSNSGLYVLSKKMIAGIPAGRPVKLDAEIMPQLVDAGEAYGFPTDEPILDIGTPEKLKFAEDWYAEKLQSS